jgi:hypothetical protein
VSSRACPDWPQLMEIAPDLQFRHYTLREVQLPTDAFVQLEGVDMDTVAVCCDLDAHVYNPGHTESVVAAALDLTHWTNVHEGVHSGPDEPEAA